MYRLQLYAGRYNGTEPRYILQASLFQFQSAYRLPYVKSNVQVGVVPHTTLCPAKERRKLLLFATVAHPNTLAETSNITMSPGMLRSELNLKEQTKYPLNFHPMNSLL